MSRIRWQPTMNWAAYEDECGFWVRIAFGFYWLHREDRDKGGGQAMSNQQGRIADQERKPCSGMTASPRKQFELWAKTNYGSGWMNRGPCWHRVGWYESETARDQAKDSIEHENSTRGWKTEFANARPLQSNPERSNG